MIKFIETTEKKIVYHYPNDVKIYYYFNNNRWVEKNKPGGAGIKMCIGSENFDGWGDKNQISKNTSELIIKHGARVRSRDILYGKEYVPSNSVLSKLQDYMTLAEIIVNSFNKKLKI